MPTHSISAQKAETPKENALDTGPRSLHRTLRILQHIALGEGDFSLARLSAELDIPKSSLLGLLRPLVCLAYIVHNNGSYVLGPAAYRLGLSITPSVSIGRIAAPFMKALVDICEETVLIGTLDRDMGRVIYVEKLESARSIRYTVPLGTSRPLYCSAAGRVLLAFSDQEYVDEYLRTEPLVALTPQTITNPAELRRELTRVRESGVAVSSGEVSSDVAGFAAPIFDHQSKMVGALAVAAPVDRTRGSQHDFRQHVIEAAGNISFGLGYPAAELKMSSSRRKRA